MYKKILMMGIFCFLFTTSTAWGTIRHVPNDYPTIQEAIDAAVSGDEVLVAPGTYLESIKIVGKYLTLRSSHGPHMTIIWGGNLPGTVVDVHSGWGNPATVIEGFEITSRYGPYYYASYASGITCVECSMKVVDCIINRCYYHGIECYEAFVEIVNSLVVDNEGIGNVRGAGLYGNTTDFNIRNCTIANNRNDDGGAGIYLSGSIYFTKIYNSIIWGNLSQSTSSGDQIWLENMAFLVIESSDLQGGSAQVYVELYSTLYWGGGMIDAVPLFVDPNGNDYHLTYPSPCKDTGDNTAVTMIHDFEGDPRIAWEGIVDMGADEFFNHLYVTGDKTPGGFIEGKFVGLPGTNPTGLFISSGVRNTPLPTAWGDFWLDSPWSLIPLVPIPAGGVMVLPGTIPASLPVPYDLPMQALIGLEPDSLSNLEVLKVR